MALDLTERQVLKFQKAIFFVYFSNLHNWWTGEGVVSKPANEVEENEGRAKTARLLTFIQSARN